jgi:hypothetical protein
MNLDDSGFFQVEPNGTVFSFDHNSTVIHSKQLTGEEFTTLTGCNMVTPGMPSSAEHDTEQCLQQKDPIPTSGITVKRDGDVFERELKCTVYLCRINDECRRLTGVRCLGCVRTGLTALGFCSPF